MIPHNGGRSADRGAAAIEFLLLFPLFLLVMFGALYFASAFNTQRALVFIAQSGADAALRVDRSQFDLSGASGRNVYAARIQEQACAVMLPLLARESRTVVGDLTGFDCPGEGPRHAIRFEFVEGDPVILITVEVAPSWRPPLVGQWVDRISGAAAVPF